MSVQKLHDATTKNAIQDLATEFRQILAGLGVLGVDKIDVAPTDMGLDNMIEGQPHYRVTLFAQASSDLGWMSATLLAEDDWGGSVGFNIIAEGGTTVTLSVPFMPGAMNPQNMVALIKRQAERRTWLYRKMAAKERELGLRN